ncbi:hypothetical protein ANN_24952 [Periplaneta americana]|uniref:Uncharacterized protein n=1 Tax=Periplaneta americana TaxID=6978 RepID=A0ABQ8S018_PERAM|nr:hypothetical protein ANN_24952 [Periplaneta americana]
MLEVYGADCLYCSKSSGGAVLRIEPSKSYRQSTFRSTSGRRCNSTQYEALKGQSTTLQPRLRTVRVSPLRTNEKIPGSDEEVKPVMRKWLYDQKTKFLTDTHHQTSRLGTRYMKLMGFLEFGKDANTQPPRGFDGSLSILLNEGRDWLLTGEDKISVTVRKTFIYDNQLVGGIEAVFDILCQRENAVHIKSTTFPCESILDYEFNYSYSRAYQREFGVGNPPKRNTILGLVNKLETTGYLVSEKGKHCSSRLPTVVVDVRASFFDERIISRNLWPPRSPDLTTPDFFLWGYLKDRVYATRPQTLDDLKHNITQEIQAIDNRVLQRVASNMERRVELCLMQNGGHFQHLL